MSGTGEIEALLATIDAAASGLTLIRIALGIRLAGQAFAGVSLLQVLQGTTCRDLPHGAERVVAGHLVLVPGRCGR